MSDAISTFVPCPLLVNASSGTAAPPVPMQNFSAVLNDYPGADQRSANSTHLGTDYMVDDPNDLTQAGWAILFASDADPAIVRQLQPLIDLRSQQVQDPKLFKQFTGNDGVLPGETADAWARRHSVSLTAPVDPFQGVPYYVLIAGSPDRISFEFQAMLKMQWAVGRLHFDDIEDYGRYAQAVVQYESAAFKPEQRKNVALWTTRNNGDLATAMLSGAISMDFMSSTNPLGARSQFTLNAFTNEKATKPQFLDILRGNLPAGPPAVIFTGSHGSNYDASDPALLRLQGALVSQEWKHGSPLDPNCLICADDIPADAKLLGTIGFLFACYSGGCPAQDSYHFNSDGSRIAIAPAPFIARLPQALLSRGMLAMIGHIDLAFPSAFIDTSGTPQPQAVRTPLELLMRGKRVGLAADTLSILWSTRSAQLAMAQSAVPAAPAVSSAAAAPSPVSTQIAQMTLARDDARNYIVLGDPAARLRVDSLR